MTSQTSIKQAGMWTAVKTRVVTLDEMWGHILLAQDKDKTANRYTPCMYRRHMTGFLTLQPRKGERDGDRQKDEQTSTKVAREPTLGYRGQCSKAIPKPPKPDSKPLPHKAKSQSPLCGGLDN